MVSGFKVIFIAFVTAFFLSRGMYLKLTGWPWQEQRKIFLVHIGSVLIVCTFLSRITGDGQSFNWWPSVVYGVVAQSVWLVYDLWRR